MSVAGVEWPDGLERTPYEDQVRWQGTNGYCRTRANAILDELELIGATAVDLQTNMRHIHDEPNVPAIDGGDPADPAAVVRFELDGERCCVAADGGSRVKDNLRAIEHYLESQRAAHADAVPPQVCQTVRANIDRPY